MRRTLSDLRPVYVAGIGLHPYAPLSATSYVALGLKAIRDALGDGGIPWPAVESSYVATARLGTSAGRTMLKHLGLNPAPVVHVENASASGSWAFRLACQEVASGLVDVALAAGVDKPGPSNYAFDKTGVPSIAEALVPPVVHFALLLEEYRRANGVSLEDIARVAVKNHANGALNPNAQRQRARSLEEVLNSRKVAGDLTALQCCPVGEGAAAAVVVSEEAVRALGLDASRLVRVLSSVAISETLMDGGPTADMELTRAATGLALRQAGVQPDQVDVIELHDAFSVEELQYVEAMGLCGPREAVPMLREGAFGIGGKCAVSPSGGLLSMGHPLGPTGIGQVAEIVAQVRREAASRQHPGARTGLAHLVGLGAVCCVHVLQRP